ncbi:FHA domain-containing protein [Pseudaquabacterium rugosum]|uniref:FHA domain-containing protein n=1 Tax=Pseudaquabacterium rugosum TaxID=2984194 RepID=A0ABU9BA40_9BURK
MHPPPHLDNATTRHPLPANPTRWPALHLAVLQVWHEHTSRRAGLQRAATAELRLGPAWADIARASPDPQRLARRLAADGADVQVLVIPDLQQPELHIGWAPWHAPPRSLSPSPNAAHPTATADTATTGLHATPPRHPHHPDPSTPTMKLPNLRQLFTPEPTATAAPLPEPRLEPSGQRAAPSAAQQLTQALQQIAEQIDEQELRMLLDTVDCRYQLWELTLYLTPGNQAPLRGLMAAHQQNPAIARQIVERAFAGTPCAGRLNTLRLKLDFKRGDSLPREASEVLVVCGRDNVSLPYTYTGQLELGQAAPAPSAAPPLSATGTGTASPAPLTAGPQGTPELLLWGQVPGAAGTPAVRRWRLSNGPATVGAADEATVQANHRHVSGEHLVLALDEQGQWTVEDRSRNGSALLDALAGDAEKPLPSRQPQRLPAAGWLRLGPLPDDPVLNFHLVLSPAAAAPATAGGSRRRVTQLAVAGHTTALPPLGRATDLT